LVPLTGTTVADDDQHDQQFIDSGGVQLSQQAVGHRALLFGDFGL
jgi:hypothetical protein